MPPYLTSILGASAAALVTALLGGVGYLIRSGQSRKDRAYAEEVQRRDRLYESMKEDRDYWRATAWVQAGVIAKRAGAAEELARLDDQRREDLLR